MKHINLCIKCGNYTMSEICKKCGLPTVSPKPPKYSEEDKYADYRRKAKKEIIEEEIEDNSFDEPEEEKEL